MALCTHLAQLHSRLRSMQRRGRSAQGAAGQTSEHHAPASPCPTATYSSLARFHGLLCKAAGQDYAGAQGSEVSAEPPPQPRSRLGPGALASLRSHLRPASSEGTPKVGRLPQAPGRGDVLCTWCMGSWRCCSANRAADLPAAQGTSPGGKAARRPSMRGLQANSVSLEPDSAGFPSFSQPRLLPLGVAMLPDPHFLVRSGAWVQWGRRRMPHGLLRAGGGRPLHVERCPSTYASPVARSLPSSWAFQLGSAPRRLLCCPLSPVPLLTALPGQPGAAPSHARLPVLFLA